MRNVAFRVQPAAHTQEGASRQAMEERNHADVDTRWQALARIDLLNGLDDARLRSIAERCRFETVEAGRTVLGGAEASTDLYLVTEGRLVARGRNAQGREVTFATVRSGEVFGEFSAIDGQPRSAEIVAVRDSAIACMGSRQLRDLMMVMPVLAVRMCEMGVAKNRAITARLFEFATMSVRQRIYRSLLRLAEAEGVEDGRFEMEAPPTQYEIAIDTGTNRETVSREMAELARAGIVETSRKRLAVEVAALRERLQAR